MAGHDAGAGVETGGRGGRLTTLPAHPVDTRRLLSATPTKTAAPATRAWSIPISLVVLALFVPYEASLHLGILRLQAYKIALLILTPLACLRMICRGCGRVRVCDCAMLIFVTWTMISITRNDGLARSLESGGAFALEALGGYMVGRAFVRSAATMRAMVALMTGLVGLSLILTIPECITGVHFIHDAAHLVFGGTPIVPKSPRLDLHRAFGPFSHPILYGTFCSGVMGLAWYLKPRSITGIRSRVLGIGQLGLGTFVSLSSGAFICAAFQLCFLAWERITRSWHGRWMALTLLVVGGYASVSMISNRTGIEVLLTRLAFDAQTGYGRLVIWQHGWDMIGENLLLGIGLRDWDDVQTFGTSIDNFWIFIGVKFGLPALLFVTTAILAVLVPLARRRFEHRIDHAARAGWMVSISALCFTAFGVHYWEEMLVFFTLLLGAGVWMLDAPRPVKREVQAKSTRRISRWT